MVNILLVIFSVLTGTAGQIAFKYGTKQMVSNSDATLVEFLKWPILLGLFLYGISTVAYILALRKLDLSYAYPMLSTTYVLVVIAAHFVFDETITVHKLIGLGFIMLGVTFVAKS